MQAFVFPFVLMATVWLFFEALLFAILYFLKKKFKWIIFPQDAFVDFRDEKLINKFLSTFDSELGWLRKPLSSGVDETDDGPVSFNVDEFGRRVCSQPLNGDKKLAVFGDSFAFCRMVADDDAWPCKLGNLLAWRVENFGVGNYGVDQAVLRFERELKGGCSPDYAVLAFVPETMARIHSYWKHFYEYGNVLAFKPIFQVEGAELKYIRPAVSSVGDLLSFEKLHDDIISLDRFYAGKFLRDALTFPYIFSLLRTRKRNLYILLNLFVGVFHKFDMRYRRAFNHVLKCNTQICSELYTQPKCQELLDAILERFVKTCRENSIEPIIVLIPQEIDLTITKAGDLPYYSAYFKKFENHDFFFDLTEKMREWNADGGLFVQGNLGPHLSASGNAKVAQFLAGALSQFKVEQSVQLALKKDTTSYGGYKK